MLASNKWMKVLVQGRDLVLLVTQWSFLPESTGQCAGQLMAADARQKYNVEHFLSAVCTLGKHTDLHDVL